MLSLCAHTLWGIGDQRAPVRVCLGPSEQRLPEGKAQAEFPAACLPH